DELAVLKDSDSSDTTKILNLRKLLSSVVDKEAMLKPFLLSIGERAEALAEAYEDRQMTTQQALLAFEELAGECIEADVERQRLNVDDNTFAIFTSLKTAADGVTIERAKELNQHFLAFPDYQWNDQQKSRLRVELYKALRPIVGAEKMVDLANTLMR